MYISDGTGEATLDAVWNTVGAGADDDFTEFTTSANWSYANNTLTAAGTTAVEGAYCIKYSLSFEGAIGDWSVGISIAGAAPVEPIFVRTISSATKDEGNISGIMMAQITQGQTVRLQVKPSVNSSVFKPIYVQVALCRAAQNSVSYFSGMHISTSTLYSNIGASLVQLTGFSAVQEMNGWTFASNELTAGSSAAGNYYMSYSISFQGYGNDSSPTNYVFELVKNDITGNTKIMASRITSVNDIGNVSAGGIISISAGDVINLYAKGANQKDLTIKKATISIFKLADNTSCACAGMKIISDQTITISTINEWVTVGDFTVNSVDLWGLSSNVLTINSTDAYGNYFLEYSASALTATATGDVFEMGVFVGNNLHPEHTTTRKLSSNSDVGSLCGIGLFNVNGPNSTITLKIRNITSVGDLTIQKSLLGLSQFQYVYYDTPLPITLQTFTAEPDGGAIKLVWQTASETQNLGFNLYRKENNGSFHMISSYTENVGLWGYGTSSDMHNYSYIDSDVEPGIHYTYMLSDVSYNMIEEKHYRFSRQIYLPLGIDLGEVFPNPFNPKFIIPFSLDTQQHVTIHLLNAQGIKIRTLTDAEYTPGSYQIPVHEPSLSSGIYFIQVQSGNQSEIQKIVMIK